MDSVNTFFKKNATYYTNGDERAKALEEKLEEKKQIARNLKNKGISLEIISESTALNIQDLQAL